MKPLLHEPVLLHEAVEALNLQNQSVIIDGTLGLGGHSELILNSIPQGHLIAIDQDPRNIVHAQERLESFSSRLSIVQENFENIPKVLEDLCIKSVDGILLDLGIASTHVDEAERGFSFQAEGPLDMRMNPDQILNASMIVNSYSEKELADMIYRYGEEPKSWKIAKAIVLARKEKKITRTRELTSIIESVVKSQKGNKKHPAMKTFQALRITVNHELDALREALKVSVRLLNPGGRLVVISYHSLEDRIVKQFFREQTRYCICPKESPICTCDWQTQLKIITKKPVLPKEEEVLRNSRSRSAKMRVAERCEQNT